MGKKNKDRKRDLKKREVIKDSFINLSYRVKQHQGLHTVYLKSSSIHFNPHLSYGVL